MDVVDNTTSPCIPTNTVTTETCILANGNLPAFASSRAFLVLGRGSVGLGHCLPFAELTIYGNGDSSAANKGRGGLVEFFQGPAVVLCS